MRVQFVQLGFLVVLLLLSIGQSIASIKYAELAKPLVIPQIWISLGLYLGTVPFLSLLLNLFHLLASHIGSISLPRVNTDFDNDSSSNQKTDWQSTKSEHSIIPPSLILIFTIFQGIAWFAQSTVVTVCELQPILSNHHQGDVPRWCPQAHFKDILQDPNPNRIKIIASIATGKDVVSWLMFLICLIQIECARRIWVIAPRELERLEHEHQTSFDSDTKKQIWTTTNISGPHRNWYGSRETQSHHDGNKRKTKTWVTYVKRQTVDFGRLAMSTNRHLRPQIQQQQPTVPILPPPPPSKKWLGPTPLQSYESRV